MNAGYATASLYVGDLHPEVTEALLFELFNAVGPVASIRVCRDSVTRRSLGYAYVNFHSVVDAERALETMNYTAIKGKPCRIMWCHRDPSLRKSGSGNVFIKNLDKSIDNKALYDTFSAFGNILSCKVATDDNGNFKGYGFVHYETQEAANLAVNKVNGMLLNGKKVFVGFFVPQKERGPGAESDEHFTNVYVKNVDASVTDEQLTEMFAAHGNVKSATIMRDAEGASKGFGFVNMETHEQAVAAVETINGTEINGKAIWAGRAMKKKERERELRDKFEQLKVDRIQKGINLYVKNVDDGMTDEKLREEFAPYGNVTSARVMMDDKGVSKGFGFVCFQSSDEATRAVQEMNGKLVGTKPLYVSLAQRKDERRTFLEQQARAGAGGRAGVMPGQQMGMPFFYPAQQMAPGMRGGQQPALPMYGMPQQLMLPRPGMYPQMAAAQYGAMPMGGGRGGPGGRQGRGPQQGGMPGQQGGRIPKAQQARQNAQLRNMQAQQAQAMAAAQQAQMRGAAQGGLPPGAAAQMAAMQQPGAVPNAMPVPPAPSEPITPASLAAAPPEQQKQILGERLFPLIHALEPMLAGKITGMLLEMDNGELLNLLESPEALSAKIKEAMGVLQVHQQAAEEGAGDVGTVAN
mmetsp:Transcript_19982/g.53825  ORF Transcript_19982/g.53825 Transcript_19982/m.53825 type:complete len:634 (-) Transcript_19982:191-2092(-)|eukprot:CAMPEP_0185185772 /NCGR_PEP_ID=MMETSP1140-20130426/3547_1 /TAXON_ID=298111 /ORGANISM="Pavlova sp., Strain CCMP459" /LENGTH=633 /DNA_ID=CAMNT_0027751993 /DNA_START=127 /DNA_END=2028 /DNA_ORIENTATION=-